MPAVADGWRRRSRWCRDRAEIAVISEPAPAHVLPGEGESWLFISYSRTTSGLATALTDALEARGYRVWIDQESITPASDWRARISVGIEGARAVLLVISERFLASPNCDRELVEAVGLGKRLIPVLAENIPIGRLPSPVPDLDLIMAADADLTAVVDEVVEAIETDLEWLDEHTRLLQAALRWAETPDDRSLLLRGRDLRAMLGRVEAAAHRAPLVNQVQRSYLAACEDNRRRVRNLGWAASLAAIAIIGLAVIATVQRAAAVQARTGAEAQRIAVDAQSLYDTQLDLGLRLALAARAHDAGPATLSALLRGLTHGPGLRATAVVEQNGVVDAVIATDRSLLIVDTRGEASSWSESGQVTELAAGVIDVAVGAEGVVTATGDTVTLPGGERCDLGGERVLAVGSAPWGAVVSLEEDDGSSVVAVEPGCGVARLATTEGRVLVLERSPSGAVAWGSRRGEVGVVASDRSPLDEDAFPGAGVTAIGFGERGEPAVGFDNGTVTLLGGGSPRVAHRGAVTAVTFVDEGLVSAGADGWIRLWDPESMLRRVELTDVGPNGQAVVILDVAQWSPGSLVSIDDAGRAQGWDLTGASPLATRVDTTVGVTDLAVIDGGFVAVGAEAVSTSPLPDAPISAVSRDGSVLGDASGDLWRLTDGRWTRSQGMFDRPVLVVDGPSWADAEAVYSGEDRWDLRARDLVWVDGETLAATASGQVVRLVAGAVEVVFDRHHGTVDALAVSPDAGLVASGGDDRLVYVWDRATGALLHTFVGHTDRVLDLAFSPDGSRLASVGEDDRMILWDLDSGAMIGSPIAHPRSGRMEAVAWETDTVLLAAGPGVWRWMVGADDLTAAACRLASSRPLTAEEASQYLDGVQVGDPC